ncbi:MAG: hypothetical protein WC356_03225 [Candidatus Micrarchaeia archaeon]|jgi:hypothetical protein
MTLSYRKTRQKIINIGKNKVREIKKDKIFLESVLFWGGIKEFSTHQTIIRMAVKNILARKKPTYIPKSFEDLIPLQIKKKKTRKSKYNRTLILEIAANFFKENKTLTSTSLIKNGKRNLYVQIVKYFPSDYHHTKEKTSCELCLKELERLNYI